MKTVILFACVLATSISTFAQEEDEESREIAAELKDAQREQQHLTQRLELNKQRIRLLTDIRSARRRLAELEEQFKEAETNDDERKIEQLEEQAELSEYKIDLSRARLDVLERRTDLLELTIHLDEAGMENAAAETKLLSKILDHERELLEKMFRADKVGPKGVGQKFEEKLEETEEEFHYLRDILQLRLELHWAEEEGDEDAIRELEGELRAIGAESQRDGNAGDAPMSLINERKLPVAVEFSKEEIDAAGKLDFHQVIVPKLRATCFSCHNGETASGELNFEMLVSTSPLVVNRRHWKNVIQQLAVGSMPPGDSEQPSIEDRRMMAAWLTNAIDNFDYTTVQQPGYESARRLTHAEYNNTVRDLTGIDLRPADRFPADMTATSGFENSANSLFLQPILMERYAGAAEAIVAEAWPALRATEQHRAAWQQLLGENKRLTVKNVVDDILPRFALRAYRRPPTDDELQSLRSHFKHRVHERATVETALKDVLQVVLVSPSFLIRTESVNADAAVAFRINGWDMASRLSYFLWASMPDEQLFELAEEDRLHEPRVLTEQVARMLQDSRSETLGSIFAAQWLGSADLDRVQRDQIDNPWATDSLVDAMSDETAMLFNSLLRNNEPIDRLIDADYTFANEELARHYGLPAVKGQQMRRVSLTESPRRGVLGHGSILAVTSFPRRTSPVMRGNWILTRLLGTPPPPPPPNVSEFSERVAENRRLTQRQKLEVHRTSPGCYPCHSQIDPLGLALEEFEWFGRHQPNRGGKRVDSTGQFPGGKPFRGLKGLSEILLSERHNDLATQVTRKMLSYALGRQLEYYDEATVRDLVQQLQSGNRRLQSLVNAIVASDTFQMKKRP